MNGSNDLSTMHGLPLAEGHVHLWHVFCDAVGDRQLLGRYYELLSEDERQRQRRFVFARDRHQFLVSHALVRTVLSNYTGHDPRAWVFHTNAYGKPEIALPAGLPLRFNLSHTAGLATCAVTAGHEVGVDVEDLERGRQSLQVARRFFAPAELAVLEQWPPERQPVGFFQFWTLKEAYVKARGMGLSIPLQDFAFSLAPDRPPAISFSARCADHSRAWQFARIRLGGPHQIAVAVRLPQSIPLTIQWRETVPLHRDDIGRVLPHNPSNEWFL